jgi:hypothetical protein
MVLKYCGALHRYIQTKMEFMDISSLGVAYRYVVKFEQKFKQHNKWEFRYENTQHPKYGKCGPKSQEKGHNKDGQTHDNYPKPPTNKGNGKSKKDIGIWCEFHKIPWHNIDECLSKQSLLAETKAPGSYDDSKSD